MAEICHKGTKFPEKGSFVKKGTIIIEAEPFVAILNSNIREKRCDNCFKACKVFRCSGCQYVHYCSKNCQKQAWDLHKTECSNMKRIKPLEVPGMVRLLGRIITKLKNGGAQEKGYYSSSEYRTFDDLMSHSKNIMKSFSTMERFTAVYKVLTQFLPNVVLPSPTEVLEIFGRMIINSFNVLDDNLHSIGVGVYLGPSIMDHSCRANTSTIFDGSKLKIRTLRDIPDFDWSKTSVAYIDVLKCTDERRKELLESYFFLCDCERCKDPESTEAAAACPNKSCTNPCSVNDLKCTKCNELFPSDFHEDFEFVESQSRRKLEKLAKDMDHAEKLEICRLGLKEQEGVLHFQNFLHVHMLERAASAASELELWEEAKIYTKQVLQHYQHYYGDSHTLTAREHLTLAEILHNCGNTEEAYNEMKNASKIIKIAFGENHQKMREVEDLAYVLSMKSSQIRAS